MNKSDPIGHFITFAEFSKTLLGDTKRKNSLDLVIWESEIEGLEEAKKFLEEIHVEMRADAKEEEDALQIPERRAREKLFGKLWD